MGEGTLWLGSVMLSSEIGLEHNTMSRVSRARSEAEDWNELDVGNPVRPYATVKVGMVF